MIQTDKYKKGVVALARKASELKPQLGNYKSHYLTRNAMFVVQFANGRLEIDIDLAKEYEHTPDLSVNGKLLKAIFPYQNEEDYTKLSTGVNKAWRRLFLQRKS